MVMAANFFKLDSTESDTDEERTRRSKDAVQSQGTVADRSSMKKKKKKKASVEKPDSDSDDGGKKSKKKKKKHKKVSGGDDIEDTERSKVNEENQIDEKALSNTDDDSAKTDMRKRKRIDDDDDDMQKTTHKPKKKKKKPDSEASGKKSKKKKKVSDGDDSEIGDSGSSKVNKSSEGSPIHANALSNIDDDAKRDKGKNTDLGAIGDTTLKPKKKKKKPNMDSDSSAISTRDANQIQSEAEGKDLKNSTKDPKKKKKKQSEDPEAKENNDGKEKRKKKQKGTSKSDEAVTTPSIKSAKKVNFSDHVEVFPATESEESEKEDDEDEQVEVVRGKRFTEEEDELIKKAVLEYVDNHALGDEGINMVMNCQSHKQIKGCWKEIATALPWRPYTGVYYRAHTLFEEGSKGVWSKEDLELVVEYQKKHGNDWRTLADAMGKHRNHVKDAWRRIRLASKKKGHWTMEEYQSLFDLVNKDLRMKAFREKHSKHGMLRDNIPWMAISDQLGTRDHAVCCLKWYDQLISPMVAKGIWANVDDYRLLDELADLDAACVDDVDWDNLLDNRDGDACRSRWNQMVHHIGLPGTKTFAEQVEILSQRYCPDLAEDREDFDNRPFDPEDD